MILAFVKRYDIITRVEGGFYMKKIMIAVFGMLALGACDKNPGEMQCGAYRVSLTFADDVATAVINGDTVELTRAVSASGEKYSGVLNDTDVAIWGHAGEWVLLLNDDAPIVCAQ